jgi:hypothetical protein
MDQLRQPGFGGRAQLPQTLALEVELAPDPADGVEERRAVLGLDAGGLGRPRVPDGGAGRGDDLDVRRVEVQRRRLPDRSGWHRVVVAGVADARLSRDPHGNLECVIGRRNRQRP